MKHNASKDYFVGSYIPGFLMWWFVLMLSILSSVSSMSWTSVWVFDVISLIVFMQFIGMNKKVVPSESSAKFIVVQSIGSLLSCFGFLLYSNGGFEMFLIISLVMKLGCFPWHGWVPQVMGGFSWFAVVMVSTLMKFSALMVLSVTDFSLFGFYFLLSSGLITSFFGALGGINQINIMAMMGYSSMLWTGWLMTACLFNTIIFLYVFAIYFSLISCVCFLLDCQNSGSVNKMAFNSKKSSFSVSCCFLSMAGFPPFLGFSPKFMVMCCAYKWILVVLMICSSLAFLYYMTVSIICWFSVDHLNKDEVASESLLLFFFVYCPFIYFMCF